MSEIWRWKSELQSRSYGGRKNKKEEESKNRKDYLKEGLFISLQ
jgi:hypothetical protein